MVRVQALAYSHVNARSGIPSPPHELSSDLVYGVGRRAIVKSDVCESGGDPVWLIGQLGFRSET